MGKELTEKQKKYLAGMLDEYVNRIKKDMEATLRKHLYPNGREEEYKRLTELSSL